MTFHERLLRLTLDATKASALLGDLEEEAQRRGERCDWIRRQALRYAVSASGIAIARRKRRMITTTRLALRDAWRSIYRFRATSAAAILILAASIAAGTVTFAVVDTIVLRPLPYPDSGRLVAMFNSTPKARYSVVAPADYYAWREGTTSFDAIAAWRRWPFEIAGEQEAEPMSMVIASASLFDVLRVRPVLGTLFSEEHETPGRDAVAVISHGLWQRKYGGDPAVLGRQLPTPTGAVTIVGVMPKDFGFPVESTARPALWRPFAPTASERAITDGRAAYLRVIGRLKPSVTIEQARADAERAYAAHAAAHPQLYADLKPGAEFLLDTLTERVAGWMQLVLAAVGVLIAIACVNVANLLLTRTGQRARDIAVRISLGATRAQVVAGLLAESLLLSALATAAGVLSAAWLLQLVRASLPDGIARADAVQLDVRVLAACALAGVIAAIVAGLLPGVQAARTALAGTLKEATGATAPPARAAWQSALLVTQVALVTALMMAATLLVVSFARVVQADLGFARQNLAGVRLDTIVPAGPNRGSRIAEFYARAETALRGVAGVEHVAQLAGAQLPLYSGFTTTRISASGTPTVTADFRRVSTGYFTTAGIRLLEGRTFGPGDEGQPVAVIDELAARQLFEGRSAIGGEILQSGKPFGKVIGVAANVRLLGPEATTQPQIYRPLTAADVSRVLLIRTSVPAGEVAPAIETTLASLLPAKDRRVRVDIVEDQFRVLTADRRFTGAVMAAMGLLALLIAVGGIYATTAAMVTQQRKEIGIRMALGASARRIVRTITFRTARLLVIGASVGLVCGWAASGILTSIVFGIRTTDALPYAVPLAVVTVAGCVAALVPARAASRIDPLVTLRTE
jgi:predicted permease